MTIPSESLEPPGLSANESGACNGCARSRRFLLWAIAAFAILALLIGPLKFGNTNGRVLRTAAGRDATLGRGPFEADAAKPGTEGHQRLPDIATRGSWVGSEKFRGTHQTGWYEATPNFTISIAGYPTAAGNRLEVDVRHRGGAISTVAYAGRNPSTTWEPWYLALPSDAVRVSIRAVDGSTAPEGWLAFSEPFTIRYPLDWQALAGLQLLATTCLAIALLYGPGLVWLGSRRGFEPRHVALAIVIGPSLLTGLGLACWAAGGFVAPVTMARMGVVAAVGWLAWRIPRIESAIRELPTGGRAVMLAAALLALFGVAKANISIGAPGELYSGLVSRSLEVGGHSDSRVPFHVVQVVANHLTPFGPRASSYFSPWTFASRGPLAGLIAAPVVLATGADVPRDMPDQPWRPFDRQGFAAYRLTLIVLASLSAWAVFGVTAALITPAWGSFAALVALLSPFFVHEMYFTWPKLITAGLVLVSFLFAHLRRGFSAGLVLGLAYLFHPLAMLSAPFIGLWILFGGRTGDRSSWAQRIVAGFCYAVGALTLIAPWQWLGRFAPGGGQAVFTTYFRLADNAIANSHTWWVSRWENFANTFIPFHLLWFSPAHESINSVYAPSPAWVHAAFLYWNTLPFALGVPGFLFTVVGLAVAFRRAFATTVILWLAPTLLLIAYWGAADSGLMRHCGQVLFLSSVALAVWAMPSCPSRWQHPVLKAFLHPVCLVWRGAEMVVMAFGTTLLNGFPHWAGPFAGNDTISLGAAAACLVATAIVLAKPAVALLGDRATS